MDYLSTNWTEKMKTNPVANKILNPNKVHNMLFTRSSYKNKDYVRNEKGELIDIKGKIIYSRIYPSSYWFNPPSEAQDAFNKRMANIKKQKLIHQIRRDEKWGSNWSSYNWARKSRLNYGFDEEDEDENNNNENEQEEHYATYETLESDKHEYFANTYIDDYTNIHHPKLRLDYVQAIKAQPLQIKPPSVFFSDI